MGFTYHLKYFFGVFFLSDFYYKSTGFAMLWDQAIPSIPNETLYDCYGFGFYIFKIQFQFFALH